MKKVTFLLVAALVVVGMLFTACPGAPAKTLIGLSFSDFATERWPVESKQMKDLLEKQGFEVTVQEANHDAKLQNEQIKTMATKGAKVIIVIAEDGISAATAVDEVAKSGVKVIAYDRLIKTSNIAAYISFDNVAVGKAQADGVVTALKLDSVDKAKLPLPIVMLGGSPTDNNATLFTSGQHLVVDPLVADGKLKIVATQGVTNWDGSIAKSMMDAIIVGQQKNIAAVVASNDGTALGALEALKAAGLSVPISGQDATAAGCNSIVKGELTVTIMKDIRNLAPIATALAAQLAKGETPTNLKAYALKDLTLDPAAAGDVQCLFLDVLQVTKDNVLDAVVKSGFQKYEDVYKDIPNPPAKP